MLPADNFNAPMIPLIFPGHRDWDRARQAFNLQVDLQPAAIAFPRDEQEVAAAVRHARRQGLRVAVQCTGHNAGPLGPLSGTLLVNTSQLTGVSIDAANRRVRVGAGVRWQDVLPSLSELGLLPLIGSTDDVGVVGYGLCGGVSWPGRKYGLQCNAVQALEVITADGERVRVDADNEPDLFWALRGGGGSFAVVTAVEFSVFAVPTVWAGVLFYPIKRASEVLHTWNEGTKHYPEDLTTWFSLTRFPDLPAVPAFLRGRDFAVVFAAAPGFSDAEGRDLLRDLERLGPEIDTCAVKPPAALGDQAMDPTDPMPYRTAHQLVGELPAAAIDRLVAATTGRTGAPLAFTQLRHMGGALARRPPDAGALAALPGEYCVFSVGPITDEESSGAVDTALDAVTASLADHRVGYYANFVEEPAPASQFFDEWTLAQLRRIKHHYDPLDLIYGNHHISGHPEG